MKRAVVGKTARGDWHACAGRIGGHLILCKDYPTHAEALDAALVAVGLAKPAEHREAP